MIASRLPALAETANEDGVSIHVVRHAESGLRSSLRQGTRRGDGMSRVWKGLVLVTLVAVAAAGASSSNAGSSSHRGGTLKLLAKAAGGTLDPQVNYTLQYWQLYQATY